MHTELDQLSSDVQTPILALGWLAWISTAVVCVWSTIIAFTGGTLPVLGTELHGGFGIGLCWFLFIAPTIMVMGHCISVMLISGLGMALSVFFPRRSDRRIPRH
ncbi:MAG: hypothetical protein EXS14_07820 [Planctomycetes bacterium]|nr:hypothetical protein [Planctomycetota bacterium]